MKTEKNNRAVIAAFDFDGTLTYRDTTVFFLSYVAGPIKTFCYLVLQLPILIRYALGFATRQQAKERILNQFFDGMSIEEVRRFGEGFAKDRLPKHIKPESINRLHWHQNQGHRCILVSASLDVYLEYWAKSAGFQDILTSRMAVTDEGKVTGKLQGLNCRREEKVRRLTELLGPLDQYQIYAYGDSHGDKELLEIADFPYYRQMPGNE